MEGACVAEGCCVGCGSGIAVGSGIGKSLQVVPQVEAQSQQVAQNGLQVALIWLQVVQKYPLVGLQA